MCRFFGIFDVLFLQQNEETDEELTVKLFTKRKEF